MTRLCCAWAVAAGMLITASTAADPLPGHWKGQWVREGSALDVWIDFTRPDSAYAGSFGSEALRVLEIPFRNVRVDGDSVHWEIVGDETTSRFAGAIAADRLAGAFTDGAARGTFTLHRTAEPTAPPYTVEDVHFSNGDVKLAGSLLVPTTGAPHPAIVFVHGSGAEGRYASRFLADRFARAGFAALIYDKRGVGTSTGDWQKAAFDDLAGDAVAALKMLAADPRIRSTAIGIHGHSQGGTIAPLIASQWPAIGFVIASSGSGVTPPESELYSYRNFLHVSRLRGDDSLHAEAYLQTIVRVAYQGEPWTRADSAAKANADAKWFSGIPERTNSFWWLAPRIAAYDPAATWRNVRAPVLLVYGAKDERVPAEASRRAIEAALRAAGNRDVTSKVFADCDHTFRIGESADGRFHWPRTPPDYLPTLTGWARSKAGLK
jgi:alpha-beta hydrolase superfamily lysophospholipase